MKNIVLFGIQGSGKGTQGKIIANKYGYTIFETGGELRKLVASGSELGNKIKAIVESGNLVDTTVIMEVIENFLHKIGEDEAVLFDGLPRKMDQKIAFDALMQKAGREFVGVLIEISREEAIKRLTSRRMCQNCKEIFPAFYADDNCGKCGGLLEMRQDDSNLDAIKNRLDAFQNETKPVIESYLSEEKMFIVNGEQEIEAVTNEMLMKLKKELNLN